MPNRIIKESICTSDTIDKLTWFEEVVFYRLTVTCDDFGRYHGHPAIVKNHLFPLKENLTVKAVKDCLSRLSTVGLVTVYEYDGKPYLQLISWDKHQQRRATTSKFPEPNTNDINCNHLISIAINCNQLQSDVLENENENENRNTIIDNGINVRARIKEQIFEIVEYLNKKTGKSFDPKVSATVELLTARLNEGKTVEQFKTVIDNKALKWTLPPQPGEKDMRSYMRPSTLFSKGHFDEYLNEVGIATKDDFIRKNIGKVPKYEVEK